MERSELLDTLEDYGFIRSDLEDCSDELLLDLAKEAIGDEMNEEQLTAFFEIEAIRSKQDISEALENFKERLNKKRDILTKIDDDLVKELKLKLTAFIKQFEEKSFPTLSPPWSYVIKITKKKIQISMESSGNSIEIDDNLQFCGAAGYVYESYTLISMPMDLKWPRRKAHQSDIIAYINSLNDIKESMLNENFYWE